MTRFVRWREAQDVLVAETRALLLVPTAGTFPLMGEHHLLFAGWPLVLEPHHPHAFRLLCGGVTSLRFLAFFARIEVQVHDLLEADRPVLKVSVVAKALHLFEPH